MAIEIKSIDEVISLLLIIVKMIWPNKIEKIQKKLDDNKEKYAKDKQEALQAVVSGDSDKLTELVNWWLQED